MDVFLVFIAFIFLFIIIAAVHEISTSHKRKRIADDVDHAESSENISSTQIGILISLLRSRYLINESSGLALSDNDDYLGNNFVLVTSKERERVTDVFESDLLSAQSKAGRYAEYLGKEIDIFAQEKKGWQWIDKIYPSEHAIMYPLPYPGGHMAHRSEKIVFVQDKRLCPRCSAELELVTIGEEVVSEICPNGHDLHAVRAESN